MNSTAVRKCPGNGYCLSQQTVDTYYRPASCSHMCSPIPCPNWNLCQRALPQQVLDCYQGRCFQCDLTFGRNLVIEHPAPFDFECPICMHSNVSTRVQWPDCIHWYCQECFYRLWFDNTWQTHPERLLVHKSIPESKTEEEDSAESSNDDSVENSNDVQHFVKGCPLCRRIHQPDWYK